MALTCVYMGAFRLFKGPDSGNDNLADVYMVTWARMGSSKALTCTGTLQAPQGRCAQPIDPASDVAYGAFLCPNALHLLRSGWCSKVVGPALAAQTNRLLLAEIADVPVQLHSHEVFEQYCHSGPDNHSGELALWPTGR